MGFFSAVEYLDEKRCGAIVVKGIVVYMAQDVDTKM